MRAEIVTRLSQIPAAEWDGLDAAGNPFLSHAFLEALEAWACVGGDTGWTPRHCAARGDDVLVASAKAYIHALNKLEWHKKRHQTAEPRGV